MGVIEIPKPSSGKRKKTAIQVAKNIDEANQIASNYGLAKNVNFTGLDVQAANDFIEGLKKTKDEFPDSFNLNFVGSLKEYNKYFKEKCSAAGYKAKLLKINDATAAYVTFDLNGVQYKSIVLSNKELNSKNYHFSLEKKKLAGSLYLWHPVGCGNFKATADHEIGHAIDGKFKISEKSQVIKDLYKKYYEPTSSKFSINPKMSNVLSGYANTSIKEFVAEAWSEF